MEVCYFIEFFTNIHNVSDKEKLMNCSTLNGVKQKRHLNATLDSRLEKGAETT